MSDNYRVIIAGGRSFSDKALMEKKMDKILSRFLNKDAQRILGTRLIEGVTIISGTAHGADKLGEWYAKMRYLPVMRVGAEWAKYGRSAGYKRNQLMANHADALVAFWDGKSRGTKHMIDIAHDKGLAVRVIRYDNSYEEAMADYLGDNPEQEQFDDNVSGGLEAGLTMSKIVAHECLND